MVDLWLLWFSLFRWRNWILERLSQFPKVIHIKSGRDGIQIPFCSTPESNTLNHNYFLMFINRELVKQVIKWKSTESSKRWYFSILLHSYYLTRATKWGLGCYSSTFLFIFSFNSHTYPMRKVLSKSPFDWLENWGLEKLCNLFKITWQVRKSWSQPFHHHIILNPEMVMRPKEQQKTETNIGKNVIKHGKTIKYKAGHQVFWSISSTWLKREGKEEMYLFNENLFSMQLTEIFRKFVFLIFMLNFATG